MPHDKPNLLRRRKELSGKSADQLCLPIRRTGDPDREAMCRMSMKGIITGMGDGTLDPGDNATRAQIAAMFMRFFRALDPA